MNNLCIFGNNILVKADLKTQEYLDQWTKQKEEEWTTKSQKEGTYDSALIEVLKARGEILPYERFLIPQYDQIQNDIQEALKDSGSILNKELNFIGGAESTLLGKIENKEA